MEMFEEIDVKNGRSEPLTDPSRWPIRAERSEPLADRIGFLKILKFKFLKKMKSLKTSDVI